MLTHILLFSIFSPFSLRGVRTGCSGSWEGPAAAGVRFASTLSRTAAGLRPEALRPPARSLADGRISIRPKARPAADKPLDGAPRGAARTARCACDKRQAALQGAPSPSLSRSEESPKTRTRLRRENDGAHPMDSLERREELYIVKLREMRLKMIDATQLLAEELKSKVEDNIRCRADAVEIPQEVRLRQFANVLGSWKYCHRARCTRSRCCKGEPNHCLAAGLPLFPPDQLRKLCSPRNEGRTKKPDVGSAGFRLR
jgi:hypothetical protein